MNAKLIILGSGSSVGVPRIDGYWGKCNKLNIKNNRTRCSAIIIKGSNNVLIDTSPDLRIQLLKNKIKNISSVILTHEHADQTNGLFELRPFYWKNKKKINIFGNLRTINNLEKRHKYLFEKINDYPALIKSKIVRSKFSLGASKNKIFFKTVSLKHGSTRSIAYIFEKTAYISDTNDLSMGKMDQFKKLNYLIIDCLKLEKHPSHFNLDDSLRMHYELKPKKTILTNLHSDLDYSFLIKKLPKDVVPAHDGLKINL